MTIEHSHGKARPTLPRASDLGNTVVPQDPERDRQRDGRGRFATGNRLGVGRGALAAVRRLLGRGVTIADARALAVARDADRLFCATLRDLPHDGTAVRTLLASHARHAALSAFWAARASELGLTSPAAIQASIRSAEHDKRAERLIVTTLDVATRLAAQAAKAGTIFPDWTPPVDSNDPPNPEHEHEDPAP